MAIKPGDPVFPIARATIGPIPSLGVVIPQFDFLTNNMQPMSEANQGPNLALTAVQARDVARKILDALTVLENSASPGAERPTH